MLFVGHASTEGYLVLVLFNAMTVLGLLVTVLGLELRDLRRRTGRLRRALRLRAGSAAVVLLTTAGVAAAVLAAWAPMAEAVR